MKLTSMQKMIIALVAIVALAVLAIVLLIVPQFTQLADLDAEAETARMSLTQAQALIAQLEQAKARASETQAELLKIGTEVPDSPQLPTLLIEIQNVSNASGFWLARVAPAQPVVVPGKGYSEIALDTMLEGTWADLIDYLTRLNKMTRLVRVTDISVIPVDVSTVPASQQGTNWIHATVKMKAYVIGQPAAAAPPAP